MTMWKDYPGEFNLELLHEELEVLPEFFVPNTGQFESIVRGAANYRMVVFPEGVRIETDIRGYDFKLVDEVMAKHDNMKKSQLQVAREAKAVEQEAILTKVGLTREEWEKLK